VPAAGRCWPRPEGTDDAALQARLYPQRQRLIEHAAPDFAAVRRELQRNGVPLELLRHEYKQSQGERRPVSRSGGGGVQHGAGTRRGPATIRPNLCFPEGGDGKSSEMPPALFGKKSRLVRLDRGRTCRDPVPRQREPEKSPPFDQTALGAAF